MTQCNINVMRHDYRHPILRLGIPTHEIHYVKLIV